VGSNQNSEEMACKDTVDHPTRLTFIVRSRRDIAPSHLHRDGSGCDNPEEPPWLSTFALIHPAIVPNSTNVALATRLQEPGNFPAAFFPVEPEKARYYMDAASIAQGLSWWSLYNRSHIQVSETNNLTQQKEEKYIESYVALTASQFKD
jgi:hypothetical protein